MTMLFTRCADTSGGPLPAVNGTCSPSSSFYCPSRYESAQVYEIEPGERVTVIVDSDELLFVMFDDDGGGGDCDGRGSTAVLTIELISENPTRSLWVPKKTLLSKLLTRADIAHRFCVSASGGDLCEHGGEEEGVLWKRSSSPAASDVSSL